MAGGSDARLAARAPPTKPPGEAREGRGVERAVAFAAGRWRPIMLAIWLGACAFLLWSRWNAIYWFALGDTDDNLRILQVRALLDGQGWYDLRQYRLDPPRGADIHWSRIVDLPIAGLRLLFDRVTDGPSAERAAVAVAPLLPLGVALFGTALAARRLLGPLAYLVAVPLFFFAGFTLNQFVPTRIDHHGWQLAMLSLIAAGLLDRRAARGGATTGLATAASLSIGLEFLPYLGLAGGIVALFWVREPAERPRLEAYGASLGGGAAAGFALFASAANRAPVCDALSPVWLSASLGGGAALLLLSRLRLRTWRGRLGAASLAAALLVGAWALAWPHCLGKPEGVSPELQRIWLSNVREVKPIFSQNLGLALGAIWLPAVGLLGASLLLWTRRGDPAAWPRAAAVASLSAASAGLLLWGTRAAPGAQLLSLPGAAALAWLVGVRLLAARSRWVRIGGPAALAVLASGALAPVAARWITAKPETAFGKRIGVANRRCPTIPAMRPLAKLPPGTVFTFVDLSPRLLALTPHRAVAGPYHRNGAAIEDVMHAFRGDEPLARRLVAKRRADYLLICPDMSESTLYSSAAPRGFYVQLRDGRVPRWLAPVALPKGSPFKMWRVLKQLPGEGR